MKRIVAIAALIALASCAQEEPESVEARADNLAAQIENRAAELEAEAENGVNAATSELEAEIPEPANLGSGNVAENETAGE